MISFNAKYGGGVKSVQRGVSRQTNPANGYYPELVVTIAAVNPAKTTLNLLSTASYINGTGSSEASLRLISATQIGIKNSGIGSSYTGQAFDASWEVIEWN